MYTRRLDPSVLVFTLSCTDTPLYVFSLALDSSYLLFIIIKLTNTCISDGPPDPDGAIKEVSRIKIRLYHNLYLNRPDPIVFLPMAVDTTGGLYDDFIRLLFLHSHHEASVLDNELSEESERFRFLRDSCFANLKGAVGLITKVSVMRVAIPLDLSSRPFIPLPRFIHSRHHTPFLTP